MRKSLLTAICIFAAAASAAQEQLPDTVMRRLLGYAYAASNFGKTLPQEKVHLHLDNTSYFHGDRIWFGCYVVAAGTNRPTALSRTLYVELLNPGGTIIEKRVLPIVDGRCNGNFVLTHLPFYSGFYEIRAYTKYMLGFGEKTVCSRTIPVFDKLDNPALTSKRRMMRPRAVGGKYPVKRPIAKRGKSVAVRFYPEGGNLVEDLPARMAFEATDADGMPLELSGVIRDKQGNVKAEFATEYGGRGAFDYTPAANDRAEVTSNGKSRKVDLPAARPQGVVMRVNNLSSADSVAIVVRKSADMPATMLGAAVICGGALSSYSILDLADGEPLEFKIDKRRMPAGVARIILVDIDGAPIADRLIFSHTGRQAAIEVSADKTVYEPYDSVRLDFSLRDAEGRPLATPISVSVRDGEDEVPYYGDMLTDLLLSSEIKGYVHRPSYYFESDDSMRRTALDRLLMVQGWRRYDWAERAGTRPFDLKYLPEQGVEVHGRVIRAVTNKPLTDIQLSSVLLKRGEEGNDDEEQNNMAHVGTVEVDSTGRFAFVGNLWGKWALNLSVTNDKNRRKASRILLDRAFAPAPREYLAAEMNIEMTTTETDDGHVAEESDTPVATIDSAALYYDDGETDMTKKVHRIKEVVVKGKKHSREEDIYRSRSTSTSYYDIPAEIDAIRDEGESITDIHELLAALSDKFVISRQSVNTLNSMSKDSTSIDAIEINGQWRITYKGKHPLFVVDYEKVRGEVSLYDLLRLSAIKAIYINEDMGIITQYADITKMSPMEISDYYSCVVFIETYPDGKAPVEAGRGVRKTWIDGYSRPDEFYMPDYSVMPKEADYRRTLYWNPELKPDEQGHATAKFYNNSRCRRMKISAETLADDGAIGVLNR